LPFNYFAFHEHRFERIADVVCPLIKPGGVILEISSHYLHSSLILIKLGFQVYAMDVEVFWEGFLITFLQTLKPWLRLKKVIINGSWKHPNINKSYLSFLDTTIDRPLVQKHE
jgi:hypothetical protein